MVDATCKAIRDMHQRHHGNEKGEWIRNQLKRKMTTAQVVETSVTVNNNSPIQDYIHPDDQTQPTFEMTPGFKPFTEIIELQIFLCFYVNF